MAETVQSTPRSGRPWWTYLGGAVIALTFLITVAGFLSAREQVPRASARAFVDQYFDAAVRDPDLTHAELTTSTFKQLRGGQQPGYSDYWSSASTVRVEAVEPTSRDDWFEVRYEVEYQNGRTEPLAIRAHLVCASWLRTYSPLHECRGSDLRLDDVIGSEGR